MLADFDLCGVVDEETNKKVSYLAAVSRLLFNRCLVLTVNEEQEQTRILPASD